MIILNHRRPFNYGKAEKEVHKVIMTEGKHAIIHQLFHEYDIESSNDIQEALVS